MVVAQFRNGKLASEHIYWDQASVLLQIGRLDSAGLPIAGVEVARKVLDRTLPSNRSMTREWQGSEGKPI
jgi:carboxymethylenebutenolidase